MIIDSEGKVRDLNKNSKELTLVVFSPYCLLRPTTNRIFDMRLCDAFAGHGEKVRIIYPYTYMKDNIRSKDIPPFYDLQHTITAKMLLTPLHEHSLKVFRFVFLLTGFAWSTVSNILRNVFQRRQLVFISRDAKSLIPALILRKIFGGARLWKVFFMAAEVKQSRIYGYVIRNCDGILAGVSTTRDAIRKLYSADENKFLLALAPVPVYRNDPERNEARKRIRYNQSSPLIVYTGKLGLDVHELLYLLEAASKLPGYSFLFTGGRASVVESVKEYCKKKYINNVLFTGFFEDSRKIRDYQMAADVLVSYYTSKDHMVEFNYPQKINEYLSTGNPVVTPDFPATRDVLNSGNVFFVEPDNVGSLVEGIRKLVEDRSLAQRIATQAKQDVQKLSFDKKAAEFLAFIRKKIDSN